MKDAAAKVLAEVFLKGFFDVFDAMFSQSFQYEAGTVREASEADISVELERLSVQYSCVIQQGVGQIAVLFSLADTRRFLTILSGSDASEEALGADEKSTLREVAEPALGSGVATMMERFGRPATQLDGVNVLDSGAAGASALAGSMGGNFILVPFNFAGTEGLSGAGSVLFSAGMDGLVPASQTAGATGAGMAQAALSADELSDILGGFPEAMSAPVPAPAPERRSIQLAPQDRENLDLVLDIRLLATARLGRVEMPLGDVLNLGPGSVLEIGHLVDEPVELLINGKLIARGDVVVVDEKFGLRVTEIVSQKDRIESLR